MAIETSLKRSPLDAEHRRLGAKMVPFAGWEMPLQYSGIVDEHNAVRHWAGIFDVSHMGRLIVSGPDAAALLRRALTYNVHRLKEWQAHYAVLCQDDGGIIDDLFVYRLDRGRFLVVGNASNAETDRDHIAGLVEPGMDVTLDDTQSRTAMIAIQGPEASPLLAETVTAALIEALPRHGCMEFELMGSNAFIVAGRVHRRTRLRDRDGRGSGARALGGAACGAREALRPRRPRHAAPGGGAAALRQRHRQDDEPVRGRTRLGRRPGRRAVRRQRSAAAHQGRPACNVTSSAWRRRARESCAPAFPSCATARSLVE